MINNYENIKIQAGMCLNCNTKPCSFKGCPLNNNIPEFINYIKQEQYEKAYEILTETTMLPSICGRVCPHFKQCMGLCVRGIKGTPVNIGDLEAFVGDLAIENNYSIKKQNINNKKIAIVGGGPAGLTAAAFLARTGNQVTIYEKYDYLGGLLVHGIPEFRLPREIVEKSIKKILELGIIVKYNQELGKNLDLKDLEKEYDNIILAFGANVSSKIKIEGENLKGVYGANELLEYNNHPNYEGKTVVVNGGGNVAMDAARTIKRLGAKKVIVVYRRAREQMPAEQKEIEEAIKEDIEFLFLNKIVSIIGNEEVKKVELLRTELVEKQGETRLVPIEIENSNYFMDVDYVVMAIGSRPADFTKSIGLKLDERGYIKVDKNGLTSNSKIYAIGDLAGNISIVAWAAKSGRDVANTINLT